MSQRKYVRMTESQHFQVRMLAASLDRSVPEVSSLLIEYALSNLELEDLGTLSLRDLRTAADRFEDALGLAPCEAFPDPRSELL